MTIQEIWQAALAERRDKAFELFDINNFECVYGNAVIEGLFKKGNVKIALKPLAELFKLDVYRYGDNAFLMYEYDYLGDWVTPMAKNGNRLIKSYLTQKARPICRRKLYANAPFNLEWAKLGVLIEACIKGDWKEVFLNEFIDSGMEQSPIYYDDSSTEFFFLIANANSDYETVWIQKNDLRHPFPPVNETRL